MKLKEWIKEQKTTCLKEAVFEDIEDMSLDEVKSYLNDVSTHGGVSGMISGLIYYSDTNKFYDKYEEDIEDLLEEFKDSSGYKNRAEAISNLNGSAENITQEKNLLAWMGYEEVARQILEEIEEAERVGDIE